MGAPGERLWWVGTRLADLYGAADRFAGAIVLSGGKAPEGLRVICLEETTATRINHNNKANSQVLADFFVHSVQQVASEDPGTYFVFYGRVENPIFATMPDRVPYNISPGLFDTCNDKEQFRRIVRNAGLQTLTDKVLPGSAVAAVDASTFFPATRRVVAQDRVGFGGHQTYVLPQGTHWLRPEADYLVSPFLEGSIPVNMHFAVFAQDEALVFPGSVQLVEEIDGRLLYLGGDYGLYQRLSAAEQESCRQIALQCARILQGLGYRGIAGIDVLLAADGTSYFLELNPRFQSSTPTLNRALADASAPLAIDAHLAAFRQHRNPFQSPLPDVAASFFAPLVFAGQTDAELPDGPLVYDVDDARTSTFSPQGVTAHVFGAPPYPLKEKEEGSTLARVHFPSSIAAIDCSRQVQVQPAIRAIGRSTSEFTGLRRDQVSRLAWLKFNLLGLGMRLTPAARTAILEQAGRLTIRDGIAGGLEIRLFGDVYVNVPVKEGFVAFSPFDLDLTQDGIFVLRENGCEIAEATLPPQHLFWGRKFGTLEGLNTVGHVNTDRLGLYPFRSCKYTHKSGTACQFCEIGYMPAYAKVPTADAVALVRQCQETLPQVRHILISGGVGPDSNWDYYPEFASAIRSATTMPLYMMMEPPPAPEWVDHIHAAGVDEIGINMEIFDAELAKRMMPGKGSILRSKYFHTLERAVSLWGEKGAVRSIMLVGLEPLGNTLSGIEALASRGVMPILSPFRPVPGTGLSHIPVPSPEDMRRVWEEGQAICERYGVTLGPLCVACQNNTIALPVNEAYCHY